MIEINELQKIAKEIGSERILNELSLYEKRLGEADCDLIIPLVGEFSSGKTSLINALSDSKKLESAAKPTTATIYKVYFSQQENKAIIFNRDGTETEVSNIEDLKNSEIEDVPLVEVFDKSTLIPRNIILVDTPGLSSSNQIHKQALLNFLPNADALFVVVDINSQITRSVTDFIQDAQEKTRKKLYLIFTQCDTKTKQEIEATRAKTSENNKLAPEQIVCVSAQKNDFEELLVLLKTIQKDKKEILKQAIDVRIELVKNELLEQIDGLLKIEPNTDSLEKELKNNKNELEKINSKIDDLSDYVKQSLSKITDKTTQDFYNSIYTKLTNLASSKDRDFDSEAKSIISSQSTFSINNFCNDVQKLFMENNEQNNLDSHYLKVLNLAEYKKAKSSLII